MSYLKFDRANLTNLDDSLEREILHTNRKGSYYSSTILGCNTRKYHGMLVVPDRSHPNTEYHRVLLSSLDETVIQHGAEFNLAVHKYAGGHYSPNGHKYVREFNTERATTTIYRVGGVVLSKELLFSFERNQLLIRYKLIDAHSKTMLRLKPFLAFRHTKELTYENDRINWAYEQEENGVSFSLYPNSPRLYLQLSKSEIIWHHQPTWYKNIYYNKEAERGHAHTEDLPVPGYFEFEIKKGEEVYISASDELATSGTLRENFKEALHSIIKSDSFSGCLRNAADQFLYEPENGQSYLVAGYPWFAVRHRDQMFSLTACSFGIDKPERYQAVMTSTIKALDKYYEVGTPDPVITGIDQPDALLWTINAIQDYSRWVGMQKAKDGYGEIVERYIRYILDNRHPLMKLRSNGLLYAIAERPEQPITWMDNTIDGYPVVDRQGYIVEYNALWYNALCFYRVLLEKKDFYLNDLIERVSESFVRIFVNQYDYLFDYVIEGREKDWNVRPNQLLAIGLTYSPLSRRLQRSVLDIVTKELRTPKGIRSLSPKSPFYRGYVHGNIAERAYSGVQGGVWSWLTYYYLSAYLRLFRRGGIAFVDRLLIPFEDEMAQHCIGTISEIYDGTPPFRGRNGTSFMMSVVAILRIRNRLDEFENYNSDNIFDLQLNLTDHHSTSPDAEKKSQE